VAGVKIGVERLVSLLGNGLLTDGEYLRLAFWYNFDIDWHMFVARCLLILLLAANVMHARQKLEVFELQNRDAQSLVPVIASSLGPEARVTADPRTNSLIVSYPEEMQENLRAVINQLDRAEPNIEVEVLTLEVKTAWLQQLGLTARSSLSAEVYEGLLPLLVQDDRASLVGRQSVSTRANLPAYISLISGVGGAHGPSHGQLQPKSRTSLAVIPRTMGEDDIELKFAHVSPNLDGPNGVGQIFSTVMIPNNGAQLFIFNQENNVDRQVNTPIIPLGIKSKLNEEWRRVVLIAAKVADKQELKDD